MTARLKRFSSFWIYPLATVLLVGMARRLDAESSGIGFLVSVTIGCFAWTLIEYLLHRCVFHLQISNRILMRLFSHFHRAHHSHPQDPAWILARPRTSLLLSGLLMLLVYGFTRSPAFTAGSLVGVWIGFLYYEWVHYTLHTSASTFFGLERQRTRHYRHHFVDEDSSFGVTSPLWDVVLRTRTKIK